MLGFLTLALFHLTDQDPNSILFILTQSGDDISLDLLKLIL